MPVGATSATSLPTPAAVAPGGTGHAAGEQRLWPARFRPLRWARAAVGGIARGLALASVGMSLARSMR
ncbi:hypothetical protein KTAU_12210 [Thermogemmatispora aurantia]|uniref:Uncharacterized protein n=1 Tax=Thermogemmatispora aurantia TaxID=2045279 RepID=A0A5J4K0B0_9CHLR|nr:hypothetical protein KTAU_12210 [Thermogemmatispora aurantia]